MIMGQGFFRIFQGMEGSFQSPTARWGKDVYCKDCECKADVIKTERKSHSENGWRGTLHTTWNELTIRCPKCGQEDTETMNHHEQDRSFYSNSNPHG